MDVGIDVGGTFTDIVSWDGAELRAGKVSTTVDQSEGVVDGARRIGDEAVERMVHGTTVATNALLERAGARVALLTTPGFEDILEIGRQNRPDLYATWVRRSEPLVSRSDRFGVDPARTSELIDRLAERGAEAVAIALLYGYLGIDEEEAIAAEIQERLGEALHVSMSGRVSGEFREFERTSTTVLNAYLHPVLSGYLANLRDRAQQLGPDPRLTVMRSSGGLMTIERCEALPAAALLSGPAGGVVATAELGRSLGLDRLISFDMGGTSTDVCRIEGGAPDVTFERTVDGYVCRLPSVAVHTVGAGGGSLAWIDDGGALRVGPRSAGSHPGPACYDRGGSEATVTDANVVLGRIEATARLGDEVTVRHDRAVAALRRIGERLAMEPEASAAGVIDIANAHMERAIRAVSVEQGADPRPAWLVAFGGAGGLHASALAKRLHMRGTVIPPFAGVFSALGLLLSSPREELARSLAAGADPLAEAATLAREVAEAFSHDLGASPQRVLASVDLRYLGQAHELNVAFDDADEWSDIEARFHNAHEQKNGFAARDAAVEATTVRATALGSPIMSWADVPPARPQGTPVRPRRRVMLFGSWQEADVWWRPAIAAGTEIFGPAVIEEPDSTTLLEPGDTAVVGDRGELVVTW